MGGSCPLIIFFLVLHLLSPYSSYADPRTQTVAMICGNQRENNSTLYVPAFVSTMESISDQVRTTGYGFAVTGSGLDTNYGLAQCYGDLSLVDCVLCYAEARTVLPQCFPVTGGRIFLDGCFMRAENYSFFQEYTGPNDRSVCGNRTRNGSAFGDSARRALSQVVAAATTGNNRFGRATVVVPGAANVSVHALAECWRTVSPSSCRACLSNASSSLMGCLPFTEGRAPNTGCFVRYSDIDFLNPIPRNRNSRGVVLFIVLAALGGAAVFASVAVAAVYLWKQMRIKNKRKGSGDEKKLVKALNESSLNFKYSVLEKATGSFAESNKLGQGGFGSVFKGVLPDGREIAVKRLYFNNKHRAEGFYNEIKIISSVEHKNLVRLLGCSCSGPESLLVYELLQNSSLVRFIFDPSKGKELDWEKRFEIIVGTTEGLVYLHDNSKARIIHRDIKASNILLDSRLRAKIADFGLARSFQENKSHISTAIAGTLGYMAPEYLAHGQLSEKADVYSFGVLLLEIVTGKQNNRSKVAEYGDSLVAIAWMHFQQRTVEEIFDPNLMIMNFPNSTGLEILRAVHVALLCVQEIAALRPSMSEVLQMLVKKEEPLPVPTSPPFMDERTMELNDTVGSNAAALALRHEINPSNSIASISQSIFYPR